MKKIFCLITLMGCFLVYLQQLSYAEKMNHKEYAKMPIRDCNSCHKGEGISPNHEADFFRNHRILASKAGNNCGQCHDQAWCLDCHQGGGTGENLGALNFGRDYKPKTHRSDFRVLHPLKALDNPQNCYRCHDEKYCNECHSRFPSNRIKSNFVSHRFSEIHLTPAGPTHALFQPQQCPTCHPNSFLPSHQWSGEHSREARRDLQACQSCHQDGNTCIRCHSARTGLRISPHPRNWGDVKGNFRSRSNGRSCIKCHDAGRF